MTKPIERNNYYGIRPWFPLVFLLTGVTIKIGTRASPELYGVVLSVLAVVGFGMLVWREGKNKLKKGPPTISYVYIATLGVAGNDVPVLTSVDYGFVNKLVSSVNEVIRRRGASSRRPTSINKPSQRTMP